MAIYSPSSTTDFMTCPQLWWFRQQGWKSKYIGNPELAAAVGIGVSRSMEEYFRLVPTPANLNISIEAGQKAAIEFIKSLLSHGGMMSAKEEKTYDLIPTRVAKAVAGFHKKQPFPSDWHTFMSELSFPDHGRARADLLCQSDLGPCVVDFKTKVTAQDYIVDQFMMDQEQSWQMKHYVYAARQMGIPVTSYAICLIVIEPLQLHLEQWVVDEEVLSNWERDARYWWSLMDAARAVAEAGISPARTADHRTKYGLCRYYDLCFTHPTEEAALGYGGYFKQSRAV